MRTRLRGGSRGQLGRFLTWLEEGTGSRERDLLVAASTIWGVGTLGASDVLKVDVKVIWSSIGYNRNVDIARAVPAYLGRLLQALLRPYTGSSRKSAPQGSLLQGRLHAFRRSHRKACRPRPEPKLLMLLSVFACLPCDHIYAL